MPTPMNGTPVSFLPLEGETADLESCCSVGGCGRPVSVRGYCRAHYIQKWRKGALPTRPLNEVLVRARIGLPSAFDRGLRKLARTTGHTYSSLVRKAVREFLERNGIVKPRED